MADSEEELNRCKSELKLRKNMEVKELMKEYYYHKNDEVLKQISRTLILMLGIIIIKANYREKKKSIKLLKAHLDLLF